MPEAPPLPTDFAQKRKRLIRSLQIDSQQGHHTQFQIRRNQAFLDSLRLFRPKTAEAIRTFRLDISFQGEESPVSTGQWLAAVFEQMLDPNLALFASCPKIHPSQYSGLNHEHLECFQVAGRVMGLAAREGVLLPRRLSRVLCHQILQGAESGSLPVGELLEDLEHVDGARYTELSRILDGVVEGKTFSITKENFGAEEVVDLIENGREMPVTEENKADYVRLVAEYILIKSVEDQIRHFVDGFHDVVPADVLHGFDEGEIDRLLSG